MAACAEDLRAAMLAKPWRLYGDGLSEEDKDRLWKMLRQHMAALTETVIDARLNGYSVARYVYAQGDDGIRIANVSSKRGELERFVPYRDGSLMYRGTAGEEVCDTNVMYLFMTHRATSTNPAGEMAAARLYAPVALRSKGFVFAAQFITRYAQPYMVAKINAGTDEEHRGFMRRFIDFLGGGAVSIEREDDVKMLQNTADGQAFKRLENLANARIQKTLLGKVKTSDLETGSRAAQEIADAQLEFSGFKVIGWHIPDWLVAGGSYAVTGKTPMAVLQELAKAAGGFVESDPHLPVVRIKPRWPKAAWQIAEAGPDATVPSSVILQINGRRTVSERCNGVFVWAEHAKGRAGDVYRQGSSREPRAAALTIPSTPIPTF
ncbi:phage portal protein family protein [Neisseria elongata]|uniref:phage portal protein family protein n=1 Tax=Neisseria elongata TaxID=495 RepID=UPI001F26E11F|nr:DUF935 family protein [Neisseria elongata]